jgi:hypothetical protein
MADLTPEQVRALDVARGLVEAGVPVFRAHAALNRGVWLPDGGHNGCGYWIPTGWERKKPDPAVVDKWRPGEALCALMGHTLDLVDLDPRNGGTVDSLNGAMPTTYAVAATPSEGWHGFVGTLGVRSRDKLLPGIDVKAGDADGNGRGFAFIAPTVRKSKTTGEPVAYRWERPPDLDALKTATDDRTGEKLAAMVRAAHGSTSSSQSEQDVVGPDLKPSPWDDLAATIAANTRHDAVHKLASALRGQGGWRATSALAYMRAVVWPLLDQSRGGHPYTEAELEADVRDVFTRYDDGPSEQHQRTQPTVVDDPASAVTLDQCHAVFRRWLGKEYDLDVLDAVLCALAAERLDGDPLWLLVISGPGAAKTETVQACAGADAIVESTITGEAALLSGTPKKERAKDATGGLLRRIGDAGVLVVKDVTSIISMSRDRRAEVLAAMREIHDGYWSRSIGADGGRTLTWTGRVAVIGAVTTAWDTAHAVISTMGDRFVNIRLDSTTGRQAAYRRTVANTGDEVTMRAELAAAVGGVLAGIDASADLTLTDDEVERLLPAADVVTLARTGLEYDYKGDVTDAHAPEMPTRFARQLQQVIRGGVALGMDRGNALRLAIRCARDTMPPVRLAIIDDLAEHPHATPAEIRRRVDLPRRTIDRQCQALHMLGVLACDEVEYGEQGRSRWHYSLANGIDPVALQVPESAPDLATPTPSTPSRGASQSTSEDTPGVGVGSPILA